MKPNLLLILCVTLLLACRTEAGVPDQAPPASAPEGAASLFAEGRTLVENNCGDCRGGTREGLEEGIASLRQAIELGYPDPAGAYELLAEAYNTLALVFAEPGSLEQEKILVAQIEVYRRLIELEPEDPQVRLEYAILLDDPAKKLEQLTRAVELAPEFAEARFVLAATLVEAGEWQKGVEHGRAAIEDASPESAERYGRRLSEMLQIAGHTAEADLVLFEARRKAAAQSEPR